MARLRPANGHPSLAMDRDKERGGCAGDYILCPEGGHVHVELRTGGLGDPRAGALTPAAKSGRNPSGFLVRNVDVSNTHFLELRGNAGRAVESGFGSEDFGK